MENIDTKEYKKEISHQLNNFFKSENWFKAKKLLENELTKFPNDHFLLTQLGEVFYEMQEYNQAKIYTEKAYNLAPNCPLASNNYAVVLYMHENNNKAIELWKQLLNKDIEEIAEGECGEGLSFAKSLINDIRFRIGDAYLAKKDKINALKYYKDHLVSRRRGLFSNFTKQEVITEIKELEKEI